MSDFERHDSRDVVDANGVRIEPALVPLVERLRALRSAWGVLAPSGLSSEKSDIAETGRALNDDLMELASSDSSGPIDVAIQVLDARLEVLEDEMRSVAFRVPVAQLRSTLPDRVSADRRGVLDLLDLMLGAEIRELEGTEQRIPSIDYLVTLLCTAGAGRAIHDPVHLTPRIRELCERSAVDYDPRLPEIEAEFFRAGDLYEADARDEMQFRALRQRKTELGASFFAPQVLRAIVTYNAALLRRIDEEVEASQDWGALPSIADEPIAETAASVFESSALAQIRAALERRMAGKAPELDAVDRIAWCLDVEYLNAAERRALLSDDTGEHEKMTGTLILVGLVCRAAVVLEEEFPAIGIDAGQLFDVWVPELADAIQQKVNRGIAGDEYREACLLSELKTKFLYTSMADVHRKNRGRTSAATPARESVGESAKEIAREAVSQIHAGSDDAQSWRDWKSWPWQRIAAIGAAVCGAAFVFAIGRPLILDPDLDSFDRDALDRVSPYLSEGSRNGEGAGTAFVGQIRDGWSALTGPDRLLVATDLVEALREQGVRDVMIYDDDGSLRIQALGNRPARVVPVIDAGR